VRRGSRGEHCDAPRTEKRDLFKRADRQILDISTTTPSLDFRVDAEVDAE